MTSLLVLPLLSSCGKGAPEDPVTLAFKHSEETVEFVSRTDLYDFVDFSKDKSALTFTVNNSVAAVEESHYLVPKMTGNLVLTVSYSDLSATCNITVVDSRDIAGFPLLSDFETPSAFQSSHPAKWGYQAKKDARDLFVYIYQKVPATSVFDVDNMNRALFSFSPSGTESFEVLMNENNTSEIKYESTFNELVSSYKVFAIRDGTTIRYKLKLSFINDIPETALLRFFIRDVNDDNMSYGGADKYVTKYEVSFHTHIGNGWGVDEKLGIPHYSSYATPSQYQFACSDRAGYNYAAVNEGLYLHMYQIVDQLENSNLHDDDGKWKTDTHVEMELWNNDFGYGWNGTYLAAWSDGNYYLNNTNGVKGFDSRAKVSQVGNKTRIDYEFFINFDNNLQNPQDGPYAYIKPYFFDPSFGENQYDANDNVVFRDDRFLHTIGGNSVGVHKKVDSIDDPYTTSWATSRANKFSSQNLRKQNLTLFIGDSFFEYDGWWVNFFTDFSGKNVFSSAIGGTTVTQWLNWNSALIAPYAEEGKIDNIVIHLGYNDIGHNRAQISGARIEKFLEQLIEMLHTLYPSAKIFAVGVGQSYWFVDQGWNVSLDLDALTKAYAQDKSYLTFVDMDDIYKKFHEDNPSYETYKDALLGFSKDGTHPKNENYHYIIEALEDAGCVFTNL